MSQETALGMQQPTELPPAFLHVRDQCREARKTLLKDPAFAQPQQLRQFIAQFVLPIMENATLLFGGAFVDTYSLAAANHEEISRISQALDGDSDFGVDMNDLNDLQKAFFALGSVIEAKADPATKAAYATCATALAEFVSRVLEGAREDGDHRSHDPADDGGGIGDDGDDDDGEVLDSTPTEVV